MQSYQDWSPRDLGVFQGVHAASDGWSCLMAALAVSGVSAGVQAVRLQGWESFPKGLTLLVFVTA